MLALVEASHGRGLHTLRAGGGTLILCLNERCLCTGREVGYSSGNSPVCPSGGLHDVVSMRVSEPLATCATILSATTAALSKDEFTDSVVIVE